LFEVEESFRRISVSSSEKPAVIFRKKNLNPILVLSSEKPADVSRAVSRSVSEEKPET